MDAINLLGTLLGGQQVVSPSGRRVLQNNHPAFRGKAPPTRQGGGLGGLLAGAAQVYAARKQAEAQQRAAQAQQQARHQTARHQQAQQPVTNRPSSGLTTVPTITARMTSAG